MNDKKKLPCDESNDGDIQEEHGRLILSPSLDFLSNDQKVVLAERSSLASGQQHQQPGAFSQQGEKITPRNATMSQDAIYKKYFPQHMQSSHIDDDRLLPPKPIVDDDVLEQGTSSEVETLEEIQERMNRFQHECEVEVKAQDDEQLLQDNNTPRIRILRCICIMIFLLILLTSVTIPLVTRNQSGSLKDPSSLESPVSIEKCYSGSYFDQNRYITFRSIVVSHHPNLTSSIDEVGTSANVALCWLSQYDTLNLNPYPIHADTLIQRFVLATLFFHFLGREDDTNSSMMFPTWLSNQDSCDWTLVGCHDGISNFRYVTSLDFSEVQIKRIQLPSEIALLRNLSKLNFKPNVFEGTIPLELNSLSLLEEFSISVWGNMSGHLVDRIIEPWKQLEKLSLELSFPSRLPDFGANTKLTALDIVDIFRHNQHDFPNIRDLSNLESLTIYISAVSDVPSYLWYFPNLEALSLPWDTGIISSEIGMLSKLENLYIAGQIPSEIGDLSQLTSLILESKYSLPSEIGRLSKLEYLQISCDITESISPLASEICALDVALSLAICYCK